jgi:8-oxo-dGTP pyrophosphatase MutT (NUDIX family)
MPAEFSCGGVVLDGRRVLLVRVLSLKNKRVWTFPKGHIEPLESARQAALREVLEETGYRCRILRPLMRVRYCFTMGRTFVRKAVQWYLMSWVARMGKPDGAEIEDVRWVSLEKAADMVVYPSDKKLIQMVRSIISTELGDVPRTSPS